MPQDFTDLHAPLSKILQNIAPMNNLLEAAKQDQKIIKFICLSMIRLETAMRRMEILSVQLQYIDLEKRII